jgi:AraC-like DNA-binding protein
MKIYIKNMVCHRCCLAVAEVLKTLELAYLSIDLGVIDFADYQGDKLSDANHTLLLQALENLGFAILSDNKSKIIEQIKRLCLLHLQQQTQTEKQTLSQFIHTGIQRDYNYLSQLFSSVEGITIEGYFISLRGEKVKEMLFYEELSLSEIAYKLGYSSVAHLCGQFKKITGLTPSQFRALKEQNKRVGLDDLKIV